MKTIQVKPKPHIRREMEKHAPAPITMASFPNAMADRNPYETPDSSSIARSKILDSRWRQSKD